MMGRAVVPENIGILKLAAWEGTRLAMVYSLLVDGCAVCGHALAAGSLTTCDSAECERIWDGVGLIRQAEVFEALEVLR